MNLSLGQVIFQGLGQNLGANGVVDTMFETGEQLMLTSNSLDIDTWSTNYAGIAQSLGQEMFLKN